MRQKMLSLVAALAGTALFPSMVQAESIDILRSIPLEVQHYASAQAMPEKFSSAEQIIQIIKGTPVILVHMEALRRGYLDLSLDEQEKLLTSLHKRRLTNENDLLLGFDHGYAQLVYKQNKTGLFFLRKANDKFKDQFLSLAYAMAEAEADINQEGSTPEETTTRKMDVTYKLSDAVKLDAEKHQPGFWPSYVRVIEKLKPMGAYQSFTRRDFSLAYLPYGNSVVPLMTAASQTTLPLTTKPASLFSNALVTSCDVAGESAVNAADEKPFNNMLAQRGVNFSGANVLIQFFPTEENHLYRVRVTSPQGSPLLSFKTYTMPNIVEDLDGDGTFEIVARQYQYNPLLPVLVYRYTPCGLELDKKVFDNFQ